MNRRELDGAGQPDADAECPSRVDAQLKAKRLQAVADRCHDTLGPLGDVDVEEGVAVQDGTEVVLVAETSFGHDAPGARGQAYPQPLGNTNPAESGQDQDDTLGYVGTTGFAPTDDTGDGIYNFNSEQEDHSVLSNIAIDAGDFEIRFIGVTNQARADESWGLDNVTVTQQ